MRWIYVSPHLDDVIFSVGGLIYEQVRDGKKVEIWTLFCGYPDTEDTSPFARELHREWGFHFTEETIRSRREENRLAAAIVGARDVYLDFIDSAYRRSQDGNWLYSNSFSPLHADDTDLPAQIASVLAGRLESDDQLVCPLAIGGHIDHVIVRRAVENLGHSLLYYADFPYVLNNPSALDPIKQMMQANKQKVSIKGLTAWQDAAVKYVSQISMEFESARKMRWAIASYWWRGLRLWNQY
jgi:LmbE family N-acetylglucosaminyl deacetylase